MLPPVDVSISVFDCGDTDIASWIHEWRIKDAAFALRQATNTIVTLGICVVSLGMTRLYVQVWISAASSGTLLPT